MMKKTLLILMCLILSGCATTRHQHVYKVDGVEHRSFKDLSDEQALKITVLTYNVPADSYEEQVAKALTLESQMELLEKRKSAYIKTSGVFEMVTYEKVDLRVWEDDKLIAVYDALNNKMDEIYHKPVPSLTDEQNARRVTRLTGMQILVGELKRRSNVRQIWNVAGQVLSTALTIAISAI